MILSMYTIYDKAANTYESPWYARSNEEASRNLAIMLRNGDKSNPMCVYPDDYDLYFCGAYDTDTGVVSPSNPPVMIGHLSSYVPASKPHTVDDGGVYYG